MKRIKVLEALVIGIAVVVLSFVATAPGAWAKKEVIPFEETRIIIEFNSTDEDVGIQVFLDGEAWNEVTIVSPDGRRIFQVKGKGSLKELGDTELFSESEEPLLADLPLEDFLALFPEGDYVFEGKTVDGAMLEGMATFTHNIPCGPKIVSPSNGAKLDPNMPIVIEWNAVTHKVNPDTGECDEASEIDIAGYEVIIEKEPFDPFHVFDVKLTTTSVTVPLEFLEPGTEYKFEVLAIEAGRNQTLSESFFCTDPLTPCPAPAP